MNAIRSICFIDVYRLEERENNGFDFQLFQPSITHFLSLLFLLCFALQCMYVCMLNQEPHTLLCVHKRNIWSTERKPLPHSVN